MSIDIAFSEREARNLFIALLIFELFLFGIYLIDIENISHTISTLFDLDEEATIPAWFSSMQLLLVGILFLSSSNWPKYQQIVFPFFLFIAGLGFIFLSMDEAATIHEKLTYTLAKVEGVPRFKGENGIWIFVYAAIAIGLFVVASRTIISFFKAYPRQAIIMSIGCAVFLAGAVGLEIISYQYLLREPEYSQLYRIEVALEELFEMAGISIILYGTILCSNSE